MDFKKNKFAKYGMALLCILLLSASAFAVTAFSVDEPDGTDDETSALYTIEWTPKFDYGGIDANLVKGDTITCYADPVSSGSAAAGFDTSLKLINAYPCCDGNKLQVNVAALGTRSAGGQYYVWCIDDSNSDNNVYSGGTFTLVRFGSGDLGKMSIDIVGGIVGAIANNSTVIGTIIVITIVLMFLLDIITGVFGIFDKFREIAGRNR